MQQRCSLLSRSTSHGALSGAWMHHCSGGPGPNEFYMRTVLENWAEKGVAPGCVVATHKADGKVDRTRPLCPQSVYN